MSNFLINLNNEIVLLSKRKSLIKNKNTSLLKATNTYPSDPHASRPSYNETF